MRTSPAWLVLVVSISVLVIALVLFPVIGDILALAVIGGIIWLASAEILHRLSSR